MDKKKIVMYHSDDAAELLEMKVWRSRDGLTIPADRADAEQIARYNGCTHRPCRHCGDPCEKHYTACQPCRDKAVAKAWAEMPEVEWDGKTPLCLHDDDRFFFHPEDLDDYLYDNDPETVMLVVCVPDYGPQVDGDIFDDSTPEDHETADQQHPEIREAMDKLNKLIRENGPYCWWPGKQRVDAMKLFKHDPDEPAPAWARGCEAK